MSTSTNNSTNSINCSNCGAPVKYQPGSKTCYCEYCKSYSTIAPEKTSTKRTSSRTAPILEQMWVISCHRCKGIYQKDKFPHTDRCILCNEPIYQEDIHEKAIQPVLYAIPFQIGEDRFIKNAKEIINKKKLPDPFSSNQSKSDVIISKLFVPCWGVGLSDPTDAQQLSNPRFAYKKLFREATNYLSSGDFTSARVLDELGDFNRLSLVPTLETEISNDTKKLLVSSATAGGKSLSLAAKRSFERHFKGPATFNLALLPIYECRYKHKNKEYRIYGNGTNGAVCCDPETLFKKQQTRKRLYAAIIGIGIVLATLLFLTHSYFSAEEDYKIRETEKEARKQEAEKIVASYDFPVIAPSQKIGERSEEVLPIIHDKPIGQLFEATGWMLCNDNQWISRKNRIVRESASSHPTIIDFQSTGLGKDNFISYKLYDMTYGDNDYLLLVKERKDGREISKKWYDTTNLNYWVLDKSSFDSLNLIKDKEPSLIHFKVYIKDDFLSNPEKIKNIPGDIVVKAKKKQEKEGKAEYNLLDLIVFTDKQADKVLFLFDKSYYFHSYDSTLLYMCSHDGVDELKKSYYETTYSNFSKLFKLP